MKLALAVLIALVAPARAQGLAVAWRAPNGCSDSWFSMRDAFVHTDGTSLLRLDRKTGKPLDPLAIPAADFANQKPWINVASDTAIVVGTLSLALALDPATAAERWRIVRGKDSELHRFGSDVIVSAVTKAHVEIERRDGATGKVKWHVAQPKPKPGGTLSSVQTSATRVYLMYSDWVDTATSGTITVLDAETGKLVWTKAYKAPKGDDTSGVMLGGDTPVLEVTGRELRVFDPATGAETSLAYGGGQFDANVGPNRLYVAKEHELVAIDLPSGRTAWTRQVESRSEVEYAMADALYTIDGDHVLHRLDARTGATLASYGLGNSGRISYYTGGPLVAYCEGKDLIALDQPARPVEPATITGTVTWCTTCAPLHPTLHVRSGDATAPVDAKGAFKLVVRATGTLHLTVVDGEGHEWSSSAFVVLTGAKTYKLAPFEATPYTDPSGEGD